MVYWEQIEKLTYKILYEEYNDYELSLLGEAYILFDKIKDEYDPTKAAFTTFYAMRLRGHLSNYLKYNNELIHIPVLQKATTQQIYTSIHTKLSDNSEFTLGDTLPSSDDTDTELSYNALKEYLMTEIDVNYSESICMDCLIHEKEYPRELRTHMYNLKNKIRSKLINLRY